jgi:hypothetical protein
LEGFFFEVVGIEVVLDGAAGAAVELVLLVLEPPHPATGTAAAATTAIISARFIIRSLLGRSARGRYQRCANAN